MPSERFGKKKLPVPHATPPRHPVSPGQKPKISRLKLWAFRLAAALLVPLLFFIVLEAALRLASSGYSTSFLLPAVVKDRNVFIQNNRFSWRFFGPDLAREPATFAIPRAKPPGTVRVMANVAGSR